MKILISDKMSDKVEDVLKSKQIDFDIKTGMSPEELKSVIDQYDGILIRSATKLTSDILTGKIYRTLVEFKLFLFHL